MKIINERYVLSPKPISSGGMSEVYSATDYENQQKVAVKLFKPEIDEEILAESFRRETIALKELKHPGIVKLFDSGKDKADGRYFIVLEWVDRDLSTWLKTSPFDGWDSFYENVGKYILEALAFAHNRHLIHRDLKTKNILIDENNHPKLTDFGIAKIKTLIQSKVTLAEFSSRPFTPPEYDDGVYTFTRDIFGFGVIVLNCLTDIKLSDYSDITDALKELDVPEDIFQVIEKTVSVDPSKRQHSAIILASEIEQIQKNRSKNWNKPRTCYLYFSEKALNKLMTLLGLHSKNDVESTVIADLKAACGIAPFKQKAEGYLSSEGQYSILGASLRYHVAIDKHNKDRLAILSAYSSSPASLEQDREYSWIPEYEFRFGRPQSISEALETIADLRTEVEKKQVEINIVRAEKDKQHIFRVWDNILRLKTEVEKNRQTPLNYNNFYIKGNRVEFNLSQTTEQDLVDQSWKVALPKNEYLFGSIEAIKGNSLTFYVFRGDSSKLPKSGRLLYDTFASEIALDRQKNSLDDIRYDKAIRSDLKALILKPENSQIPKLNSELKFFQDNIDEAKRIAVCTALGTEDFLVVEGPPGTGKTTFIAETILQVLKENPNARILLTSQTNVALDNAIERIRKYLPKSNIVRIGRNGDPRISAQIQDLLIENRMYIWQQEVLDNAEKFLEGWAIKNNINPQNAKISILLGQLHAIRLIDEEIRLKLELLEQELNKHLFVTSGNGTGEALEEVDLQEPEDVVALKYDIAGLRDELKQHKEEIKAIAEHLRIYEDDSTINELIDLNSDGLEQWIAIYSPDKDKKSKFKELLDIHLDWKKRFGKTQDFQAALLSASEIVCGTCLGILSIRGSQNINYDLCIIDEASKATSTELLVPISRSRKWVLVGDPKQLSPFQDELMQDKEKLDKYDLRKEDIEDSLFKYLLDHLPSECHTILNIQHRMVAPIGNLISECFYNGMLKNGVSSIDTNLRQILPQPITWISTSRIDKHYEYFTGSTYTNNCEVNIIQKLLKQIDATTNHPKKYEVVVLTGYSGQKRDIDRALVSQKWERIIVECNTVDAFQGREADICIYSVTRSNKAGNLGFLNEMERINVALSRGKFYLVIVGDHVFCRSKPGQNPFSEVVTYIEVHPETCTIVEGKE